MDSPTPSPVPTDAPHSAASSATLSRRQRLWGLAKATRDNYIPKITTSVSLFAQGVTARSIEYDECGMPVSFPTGTQITLYPSYSRKLDASRYNVSVRGLLWCPGTMSRKNRFIISLAKQITRYGGDEASQLAAVSTLQSDAAAPAPTSMATDSSDSDAASLASSTPSVSSETRDADALIKERLAPFIARSIPNAALTITIGAEDASQGTNLRAVSLVSDQNGYFNASIDVSYKPSVVQVTAKADETVCGFQEVNLVPMTGTGIISDIDDTVKLTGVVGDKRELMSKLLTGDVSSWEIAPVVKWYKEVLKRPDCTFHYVSNSPWQLYSLIQDYFHTVKLPPGSFHLKHYTGNIMASLMEPSSSRKKRALSQILEDFPSKKFICIGDSGERDLEAYSDLAKCFPGRIKAIYIRAVDDSFSDANETRILSEIRWLIKNKAINRKAKPQVPIPEAKDQPDADLIDLSDNAPPLNSAKLPPAIPKKPKNLQGIPVKKEAPPPLPNRSYLVNTPPSRLGTPPAIPRRPGNVPPPPPPRRTTVLSSPASKPDLHSSDEEFDINPYAHGAHETPNYYELQDYDNKGAQWLQRITTVLQDLEGTGTEVYFFKDGDTEFFKKSLDCIK